MHFTDAYTAREWYWKFYRAAYRGGSAWLFPDIAGSPGTLVVGGSSEPTLANERSFLHRFGLEERDDWLGRRSRSYYENYPAHVVNTYTAHVLAKPITASGPQPYMDWLADPLGNGARHGMLTLRKRAMTTAQVYGMAFAVTDLPAATEPVVTDFDRQRLGLKPYTYVVSPLDVPTIECDQRDRITLAKVRHTMVVDGKAEEVLRAWTADETWIERGDERLALVHHGLGKVPIDVLYSERDPEGSFYGLSRIRDISFLAREVYNLVSLQQQSLYFLTYPVCFVPDPSNRLGGKLRIGTQQAIPYDPGSGGVPVYVHPPLEGAEFLGRRVQELIDEIRALSGLSRGKGEQSVAARSADALLVETQDKGVRLRDLASNAEEWETAMGDTVLRWTTGQPGVVNVSYPQTFSVGSFLDDLDEGLRVKDLGPPTPAWNAVVEDLLRRKLASIGRTPDDVETMLAPLRDVPDVDTERPTLTLAPTDAVQVISVNEARSSLGLSPLPGGDVTIPEFSASKLASVTPPSETPAAPQSATVTRLTEQPPEA